MSDTKVKDDAMADVMRVTEWGRNPMGKVFPFNASQRCAENLARALPELDRLRAELEAIKIRRLDDDAMIENMTTDLYEARRVIDEARKQVPVGESMGDLTVLWALGMTKPPPHGTRLYARPVPPAAVPDDVAKDAMREYLAASDAVASEQKSGTWTAHRSMKYNDPEVRRLRAARSELDAILAANKENKNA